MSSSAPQPVPSTTYLVAIDDTPADMHVLDVACSLRNALGGAAELHVLHVVPGVVLHAPLMPSGFVAGTDAVAAGRQLLDRASQHAAEQFAIQFAGHVVTGEASREILELAAQLRADLLILGCASRSGFARVALGSVADDVLRGARCPTLVVRRKDYSLPNGEEIEPACADCLAVRAKSNEAVIWCSRHSEHHPRGHLFYQSPPAFAMGSMNLRP